MPTTEALIVWQDLHHIFPTAGQDRPEVPDEPAETTSEGIVALNRFSLEAVEGRTLCLIGSSGCGKTTALRLANRMLAVQQGRVLFQGRDTRDYDPLALRRKMGYVPQGGQLFPHLSVADNIGLLPKLAGWKAGKRRERSEELLALIGLPAEDFAHRYPRDLSGGQRQRIALARALALNPDCVLMDEPLGALDPITRRQTQHRLYELCQRLDKTMVLVTHSLAEAFLLGDVIALMSHGQVVQQGNEEDFRRRPASEFVEHFVRDYFA